MKVLLPQKAIHTQSTQPSRREFLTKTALLTGGIFAFGLPLQTRQPSTAMAAAQVAQGLRYALDLNGQIAGPLVSVESGFISGQVVAQQNSESPYLEKHLSTIVHEDIAVQCRNNMSPALYGWIQEALEGNTQGKSGTILTTDLSNQIMERKLFSNALLREVAFPALDRSDNMPALLGLTIKPSQLSYQAGTGNLITFPGDRQFPAWEASNFRFNIDGLEQACAHVVRIESLDWKQSISQGTGGFRSETPTVGQIQTPNLVVTLPQSQAEPFTQWFYQFVIQGHASNADERQGLLEYLGPDLQTPLFELSFGHLGIFRMSPVPQAQTNAAPMVKVEMYCETMHLTRFPGGGASSSSASQPAASTQPSSSTQNANSTPPIGAPPRPKTRILPRRKKFIPRLPQKQ